MTAGIPFLALLSGMIFLVGNEMPEPYLREGNVVLFHSVNHQGKKYHSESSILLEIVSVAKQGDVRTSKAEFAFLNDDQSVALRSLAGFMCDGVNFCERTTNWLYEEKDGRSDIKYRFSGDSIVFPLNMKVGDTLPDAHARREITMKTGNSDEQVRLHKRKVSGIDTLYIEEVAVPAFRVEGIMSSETVSAFYDGNDKTTRGSYVLVEWFSTRLGIVQTEYRMSNGYSKVTMERSSFKK